MKKFLTTLTASSLLLAMPMNVLAEDQEITEDCTQNIKLTANATSSYSVKLPQVFDVTNLSTTLTIYAKGDIAADETLDISYASENIALKDTVTANPHEDIPLSFEGDGVSLTWDDIDDDYDKNTSMTITITHGALTSGSWEAQLPITIALSKAQA